MEDLRIELHGQKGKGATEMYFGNFIIYLQIFLNRKLQILIAYLQLNFANADAKIWNVRIKGRWKGKSRNRIRRRKRNIEYHQNRENVLLTNTLRNYNLFYATRTFYYHTLQHLMTFYPVNDKKKRYTLHYPFPRYCRKISVSLWEYNCVLHSRDAYDIAKGHVNSERDRCSRYLHKNLDIHPYSNFSESAWGDEGSKGTTSPY